MSKMLTMMKMVMKEEIMKKNNYDGTTTMKSMLIAIQRKIN